MQAKLFNTPVCNLSHQICIIPQMNHREWENWSNLPAQTECVEGVMCFKQAKNSVSIIYACISYCNTKFWSGVSLSPDTGISCKLHTITYFNILLFLVKITYFAIFRKRLHILTFSVSWLLKIGIFWGVGRLKSSFLVLFFLNNYFFLC